MVGTLNKKARYYGSQILQLLFERPGISRAEIARDLELDKAIVTNIVASLIDHGIVQNGTEDSTRRSGRKPVPLYLSESTGCVIGMEMQPDFVAMSAVSPSGRIILTKEISRHGPAGDVVSVMRDAVSGVLPDLRARGLRLLGIGAGLAAIVDPVRGVLEFSTLLDPSPGEKEVARPLQEEFGVPVFVDNDANCCSYGALVYPEHPEVEDFLYVLSEFVDESPYSKEYQRIGIGMSFVFGGRVHYGARNASGEFRSAFAQPGVEGQIGVRQHTHFHPMKTDRELLDEFTGELARNIAFLVNMLDLSAVYFGGGIEVYQTVMRPALEQAIHTNWIYEGRLPRTVSTYFANPGDRPVAKGAAAIVLQHIFSGPDYEGFGPVGLDMLV